MIRRLLTLLLLVASFTFGPTITVAQQTAPIDRVQYQDQTVYITKSGKKYHRAHCRYLSQSSIPISLAEARARGYTACKVCKPPSLD
jgi:hypothetical protein